MSTSDTTTTPGFVLLSGDDTISRLQVRDELVKTVKSREPSAEIVRFSQDDQTFADFSEQILTPSLLSSMRIFIVSDLHALSDKDFDSITALFPYEIPDACVILETDKQRSGKKTRENALSKKYTAFLDAFGEYSEKSPGRFMMKEFVMPPDYKMAEWVESRVTQVFNRRIAKPDAEYLIDLAGTDPSILFSELQKIDLFLDDKAPISRDVIETVVGSTRLMSQYELAQAIAKKDDMRVLEIIDSVYVGNVYLPMYSGAIFRQFWPMFKIFQLSKSDPELISKYRSTQKRFNRQLQEETGLAIGVAAGILSEKQGKSVYPVIVKSGIVEQSLAFNNKEYMKIFSLLKEFDVGLKTGKHDDSKTSFQLFCYKIMHVGELDKQ
jgi:DNA polymerase III delta subunit